MNVAANGAQGDNSSGRPRISADGQFVAFLSVATNLVPGDSNGTFDVFVAGEVFDVDSDGVRIDTFDNCPIVSNSDQADLDADGTGDACDSDDDGDAVLDAGDNCPVVFNPDQADADGDGLGDGCDADDDNDDLPDSTDHCPVASSEGFDVDGDGCRDTLPRFKASVMSVGLPDSIGNTVLRKADEAEHLLCVVRNPRGAVQKLRDLGDYLDSQSGKKLTPETAAMLNAYVSALITQIQQGRNVCQ